MINYDMPKRIEVRHLPFRSFISLTERKLWQDNLHRVGRTGRAGAKGTAIGFVTFRDIRESSTIFLHITQMRKPSTRIAKDLVKILADASQPVPSQLADLAAYGGGGSSRGIIFARIL